MKLSLRITHKPLGQGTVHNAYRVLRAALNRARRLKLVIDNPCNDIDPPSYHRPKVQPLRPEEARALLGAVRGHRLEALWTVALSMGIRPSEAIGLTWDDIDWNRGLNGSITIRQQIQPDLDGRLELADLKTESAVRTLSMPAVCASALRAHYSRQLEEKVRAWEWQEHGLVFTTEGCRKGNVGGRPLNHNNVARMLRCLCRKAGIDHINPYRLRHTCASLLKAQGADLH